MKEIKEIHAVFSRDLHPLENFRHEDQKQIDRSVEHQQEFGRTLNTLCNCQNSPVRILDQSGLIDDHQKVLEYQA